MKVIFLMHYLSSSTREGLKRLRSDLCNHETAGRCESYRDVVCKPGNRHQAVLIASRSTRSRKARKRSLDECKKSRIRFDQFRSKVYFTSSDRHEIEVCARAITDLEAHQSYHTITSATRAKASSPSSIPRRLRISPSPSPSMRQASSMALPPCPRETPRLAHSAEPGPAFHPTPHSCADISCPGGHTPPGRVVLGDHRLR